MDRHDDELLAKQVRNAAPPRNDGLIGLTVAVVFVMGFVLGGSVFASKTPVSHNEFAVNSATLPATFQR